MTTISASTTSTTAYKVTADTTGTLVFQTGASPTTAVTVDTSQRVGIGTASPSVKLDISSSGVNNDGIKITSSAIGGPSIYLNSTDTGGRQYNIFSTASGDSAGAGKLAFYDQTAGSYRMVINSAGSLLVGATSIPAGYASTRFYVDQSAGDYSGAFSSSTATVALNYGLFVKYINGSPNGTGNEFLTCSDSTTNRALIRSNGGLANYSANNVNLSDRREKTNFAPAGEYLSKICAIPVQTFNYIDQNMEDDPGDTLGVVAQDVQAVAPELVMESNWGTKEDPKMRLSIYQTDLQYALMKCIQELKAELDVAKAEIAALKGAQ